jgi:hypothetical protein
LAIGHLQKRKRTYPAKGGKTSSRKKAAEGTLLALAQKGHPASPTSSAAVSDNALLLGHNLGQNFEDFGTQGGWQVFRDEFFGAV